MKLAGRDWSVADDPLATAHSDCSADEVDGQ